MTTLFSILLASQRAFAAFGRLCLGMLVACLFAVSLQGQGCAAPGLPKVTSVLSTKMGIAWQEPASAAGSSVRIGYAEYPGSNFINREFPHTAAPTGQQSIELTGLKPATKYIIRISRLCAGVPSLTLSLGTVRTLSKAQEDAMCSSALTGDLCEKLKSVSTGERGPTYIDVLLPQLPSAALSLAAGQTHQVKLFYKVHGATGPATVRQYNFSGIVGNTLHLDGLLPNTLYDIGLYWSTGTPQAVANECVVTLNPQGKRI